MVVAAVIEREGQVLIGQRRTTDRHALKWEFPGGKVEPLENPKEALRRELREELNIEAEIGPEIVRYEFQYPKRSPILLIFHRVTSFEGEVRNEAFNDIRWEHAGAASALRLSGRRLRFCAPSGARQM
jgi:8-oxo-dGTP diphosphatase